MNQGCILRIQTWMNLILIGIIMPIKKIVVKCVYLIAILLANEISDTAHEESLSKIVMMTVMMILSTILLLY